MPVLTYSEELHYNITNLCHNDGVGCDGYHDDGRECICGCHNPWTITFLTNEDVREYHIPSDVYRLATSEEDASGYRTERKTTFDGKVYVLREQYR